MDLLLKLVFLIAATLLAACANTDYPTGCSEDPSHCDDFEGADSTVGDVRVDSGIDSTFDAADTALDTDAAVDISFNDVDSAETVAPDTSKTDAATSEDSPETADGDAESADSGPCATPKPAPIGCGRCGTSSYTCDPTTGWVAGTCMGEGVCASGTSEITTGACTGVFEESRRTCTSACAWGTPTCELKKGWHAMSSAPTALIGRIDHTAIFTGSSLIVFGGQDAAGPLSTGGRWDLQTNTWTMITPPPGSPPLGRALHSAVWTGSRMLVWGGETSSCPTGGNEGFSYDPVTDTWTTVAASPLSPRYGHDAVWSTTTNEMIVWGGTGLTGACARSDATDGAAYKPSTDTWRLLPALPAPRSASRATWSGSELILWGGWSPPDAAILYTDGLRLDPTSSSWMSFPAAAIPWRQEGVVLFSESDLFVFGGETLSLTATATGARYRPGGAWTPIPTLDASILSPPNRYRMLAWGGAGRLWVWSGQNPSAVPALAGGASYEPSTNTWRSMDDVGAPSPRIFGTATWTGKAAIVWGGTNNTASPPALYFNAGAIFVP